MHGPAWAGIKSNAQSMVCIPLFGCKLAWANSKIVIWILLCEHVCLFPNKYTYIHIYIQHTCIQIMCCTEPNTFQVTNIFQHHFSSLSSKGCVSSPRAKHQSILCGSFNMLFLISTSFALGNVWAWSKNFSMTFAWSLPAFWACCSEHATSKTHFLTLLHLNVGLLLAIDCFHWDLAFFQATFRLALSRPLWEWPLHAAGLFLSWLLPLQAAGLLWGLLFSLLFFAFSAFSMQCCSGKSKHDPWASSNSFCCKPLKPNLGFSGHRGKVAGLGLLWACGGVPFPLWRCVGITILFGDGVATSLSIMG